MLRFSRHLVLPLSTALVLTPLPISAAQDEEDSEESAPTAPLTPEQIEQARRTAEAAVVKAEAEARSAVAAADKAETEAADASSPDPSNLSGATATLGDGAGSLETSSLASLMIRQAGARIGRAIESDLPDPEGEKSEETDSQETGSEDAESEANKTNIFIISRGEELSFGSILGYRANLRALDNTFGALALTGTCPPNYIGRSLAIDDGAPAGNNPEQGFAGVLAAVDLIAGAIRTDSELRGASIDADAALLIAGIVSYNGRTTTTAAPATSASATNVSYIAPGALLDISGIDNDPNSSSSRLLLSVGKVQECITAAESEVNAMTAEDKKDPVKKARATKLTAAAASGRSFLSTYFESKDGKPPRISNVLQEMLLQEKNALVLRVEIDLAHGSVLTRRNLGTAIGFGAYAVSGGVTVTYQLTDPATGVIKSAGLITCNTQLLNLRDAQNLAGVEGGNNFSCIGETPVTLPGL